MNAAHLDHVNLRIPADRVDDAVAFYRDTLGFVLEDLDAYRAGERPIFSIRLSETSLIHLSPSEQFDPPAEANFDHVAVVVEDSIGAIEQQLRDAGVEIERGARDLKGATGTAPALYVRDPFGYRMEIKTAG
ncbi:VOC family protein [Halolamina salifodinae]|uniref:Catechol 2,3-dioxygenase-like lactoylglutathione lyase family enzyme n=1 Tax=Halolamina salifodinae TaxID=1202767 RepID=A0A8T4GWW1_9EURY|nr:VOC family protein [Halolamina salifodinae]MBP1987487.1 catechol 2,3-dioxygenase-like lactoylglutathione lyase family enzyme [Halolamina salifodinae]